jgi:hypothetical protein
MKDFSMPAILKPTNDTPPLNRAAIMPLRTALLIGGGYASSIPNVPAALRRRRHALPPEFRRERRGYIVVERVERTARQHADVFAILQELERDDRPRPPLWRLRDVARVTGANAFRVGRVGRSSLAFREAAGRSG